MRVALKNGFLSSAQITHCLQLRGKDSSTSTLPLNELFIQLNYLTPGEVEKLERAAKAVLERDIHAGEESESEIRGAFQKREAKGEASLSETRFEGKAGGEGREEDDLDLTFSELEQFQPQERKEIGKYQIIDILGQGGMGVVYLARDPEKDRKVAIKMLRASRKSISPRALRRFQKEARAMSRLDHFHIVRVLEVGKIEDGPYLVMDYIQGPSLKNYLREENLSLVEKIRILIQIGSALQYAHQQGIVHRDIKPANILMEKGENPVIMDFGLAKEIESSTKLTRTGSTLGTPSYMSPEQARGELEKVDSQSDLFSMGAVAYELFTGHRAFWGKGTMATIYKVIHEHPPPPREFKPNLPEEIEEFLEKALEKDRSLRYGNAGEMVRDLREYLRQREDPLYQLSQTWKGGWKIFREKVGSSFHFALILGGLVIIFLSYLILAKVEKVNDKVRAEEVVEKWISKVAAQEWDEAETLLKKREGDFERLKIYTFELGAILNHFRSFRQEIEKNQLRSAYRELEKAREMIDSRLPPPWKKELLSITSAYEKKFISYLKTYLKRRKKEQSNSLIKYLNGKEKGLPQWLEKKISDERASLMRVPPFEEELARKRSRILKKWQALENYFLRLEKGEFTTALAAVKEIGPSDSKIERKLKLRVQKREVETWKVVEKEVVQCLAQRRYWKGKEIIEKNIQVFPEFVNLNCQTRRKQLEKITGRLIKIWNLVALKIMDRPRGEEVLFRTSQGREVKVQLQAIERKSHGQLVVLFKRIDRGLLERKPVVDVVLADQLREILQEKKKLRWAELCYWYWSWKDRGEMRAAFQKFYQTLSSSDKVAVEVYAELWVRPRWSHPMSAHPR